LTIRRCLSVLVLVFFAAAEPGAQVSAPRRPTNLRIYDGSPAPPRTLRVMTWNIHFGKSPANVLNLEAQAQVMANSGADVILLQEASTWDGDQPNRFPQLLASLTGRTWYRIFAAHNGGTTGEGTLILSRLPLVSSSGANFHDRGFSRVAVSVGGVIVNIFNGHLAWSPTTLRSSQLAAWMDWMRDFNGPEIAGGDFNSWWGESWIATMEAEYSDTWEDVTGSDENGYTLNNVRFDYLFRAFDSAQRLTPTSCVVISTTTSDHRPVVAAYEVR
jgi:endonuclease/exonuclease/phosphatase family metal-dependent hydrolase